MTKGKLAQDANTGISYHQIQVQSRNFDEELCQWGKVNVEQGAVIHPGYVTFDPIVDGLFGAWVKLALCERFEADPLAQRRMVVPSMCWRRTSWRCCPCRTTS